MIVLLSIIVVVVIVIVDNNNSSSSSSSPVQSSFTTYTRHSNKNCILKVLGISAIFQALLS